MTMTEFKKMLIECSQCGRKATKPEGTDRFEY